MHWESLARWIPQRVRRDARELGVPLVSLQAVDECNTIDWEQAVKLLNVPNIHNTGHIHNDLPLHIGMGVFFGLCVRALVPAGAFASQGLRLLVWNWKCAWCELIVWPGQLWISLYQPSSPTWCPTCPAFLTALPMPAYSGFPC